MKRYSLVLLLVISLVGIISFARPAKVAASIDDFVLSSYQIDYYLSRDTDRRSTLKTVESIDADFPTIDQNHGIERAVPKSYDGHTTNLHISSVLDGTGHGLHYTTYDSNNNLVVRIGDAGTYVHGRQHYTITYTRRDVTKSFADTKNDEFYWDTNGTDWAVPIESLKVNLHIPDALSPKLTGNQACYVGASGSTTACDAQKVSDGFTTQTANLAPYENVTLAIGFQSASFTPYQQTLLEKLVALWIVSLIITFVASVVILIWLVRRYTRASNRSAEHTTIVPEYIPPKNSSVAVSARVYNRSQSTFSAQLIDFAVRKYIKIYQTREKSWLHKAQYELEIIRDITDLRTEEQELLTDIFPSTDVGTRLDLADMKKNARSVAIKLSDNPAKLEKAIKGSYGLRAKNPEQSAWFRRMAGTVFIVALLSVSPWLLSVAIISLVLSFTLCPLTDKGLALFHYLEGLKLYIKTAEVDRIRMLQSPEGAEKLDSPIDTNDKRQLVKLYEKVLPYAMLFGLEKAWNNQLGEYYASLNQSPDWYQGNSTVFNAAVFSSAISNFSTAASYSNPTSSSSGGSSGGGSSGGGGGGGGGGGW